MKPLMPFAGLALGLFGFVQVINFELNREMAVSQARRDAVLVAGERHLQDERDKAQIRIRIHEEETARKVALIHEVVDQARRELTAAQ